MGQRVGVIVVLVAALAIGLFLLLRGGESSSAEGPESVTRSETVDERPDVASLRGTQDAV